MSDIHKTTIVRSEPQAIEHTQQMHPLVSAAMQHGELDPATLRDLLALQREWEAGEARKEFTVAMAGLKRDLPAVLRHDKKVAFGSTKFTHTTLAAVMDAITEPLTNHGFSLGWRTSNEGKDVAVTCRLTHQCGHFDEITLSAPPDNKGSKNAAQAIMSTVTMLERYTALALLGIATADMKEPTGGEARQAGPDASQSMKAAQALGRVGVSRDDAEAFLEKRIAEWGGSEIRVLRALYGVLSADADAFLDTIRAHAATLDGIHPDAWARIEARAKEHGVDPVAADAALQEAVEAAE